MSQSGDEGERRESQPTLKAELCDDDLPLDEQLSMGEGYLFANRYEVISLLGHGGMSVVYRVRDQVLDERVALKLFTSAASSDDIKGFLREVRLARRVTHPNVARTHDLGEHEGSYFLTMELVEGESLDQLFERERPLALGKAVYTSIHIAKGLEAAHRAGIVHLDLKPSNVMLAANGRVVVTDFGVAKALQIDSLKHSHVIIGTPQYMSPEQVSGASVDERSDLYSLGLLLYEMLTGVIPFTGGHPLAVALARLRKPPLDPRVASEAEVPDTLAELIMSCLAIDPDERPPKAGIVREALEGWQQGTMPAAPAAQVTQEGPYAQMPRDQSTLAILPLRYRGPADYDYLGEGLAEELIDLLSRSPWLRVLALGATKPFKEDRNPARLAESLDVDVVVDGTVHFGGERVRVTARLVEAPQGVQIWNEQFQAPIGDILSLQESMGRRIAEALRLEVQTVALGERLNADSKGLYLRARRLLRRHIDVDLEPAVELLNRCLSSAPEFGPALAIHAMACSRALWNMAGGGEDLEVRAADSVARAKEIAPEIAETHIAAGLLAQQRASYGEAASAFAEALSLAPTCAEAHQWLGRLQVEAGKAEEGIRRLELSLELDPTLKLSRLSLARTAALLGDREGYNTHMSELSIGSYGVPVPVVANEMRAALWLEDMTTFARLVQKMRGAKIGPTRLALEVGRYVLGEIDSIEFEPFATMALRAMHAPRLRTIVNQLLTEAHASQGSLTHALAALQRATDDALIDIEWLERCPTLEPLREENTFLSCAATVKERAQKIWID